MENWLEKFLPCCSKSRKTIENSKDESFERSKSALVNIDLDKIASSLLLNLK